MPTELIKRGDLDGALAEGRDAVRAKPGDPEARVFLFQLESVLGHWEKARNQLEALAALNPEGSLLARIFGPVIESEAVRAEVFAGRKTPVLFGEPEEWMGMLVEACRLVGQGDFLAAEKLRGQAFEAAAPSAGLINGEPFEWLADADTRLGPIIEAIIDGCYRWVPVFRITELRIEAPVDLRDLVWAPATFTWTNNGTATGFIPVRYPGTETSSDAGLRLARRTEWREEPGGTFVGLGQRVLATDQREMALLEVREVKIGAATESGEDLDHADG